MTLCHRGGEHRCIICLSCAGSTTPRMRSSTSQQVPRTRGAQAISLSFRETFNTFATVCEICCHLLDYEPARGRRHGKFPASSTHVAVVCRCKLMLLLMLRLGLWPDVSLRIKRSRLQVLWSILVCTCGAAGDRKRNKSSSQHFVHPLTRTLQDFYFEDLSPAQPWSLASPLVAESFLKHESSLVD